LILGVADGSLSVERLCRISSGQLAPVLAEVVPWQAALSGVAGYPSLSVLSSPVPLQTAIPLLAACIGRVLGEAKRDFDVVIIDTPSLLSSGETSELCALAGMILLCVESNRTPLRTQHAALAMLDQLSAHFGGIIFNQYANKKDASYGAFVRYHSHVTT
jgi:Mrp family chromosome partitioning ATPase